MPAGYLVICLIYSHVHVCPVIPCFCRDVTCWNTFFKILFTDVTCFVWNANLRDLWPYEGLTSGNPQYPDKEAHFGLLIYENKFTKDLCTLRRTGKLTFIINWNARRGFRSQVSVWSRICRSMWYLQNTPVLMSIERNEFKGKKSTRELVKENALSCQFRLFRLESCRPQ
jgi:hypothetical protein